MRTNNLSYVEQLSSACCPSLALLVFACFMFDLKKMFKFAAEMNENCGVLSAEVGFYIFKK